MQTVQRGDEAERAKPAKPARMVKCRSPYELMAKDIAEKLKAKREKPYSKRKRKQVSNVRAD